MIHIEVIPQRLIDRASHFENVLWAANYASTRLTIKKYLQKTHCGNTGQFFCLL